MSVSKQLSLGLGLSAVLLATACGNKVETSAKAAESAPPAVAEKAVVASSTSQVALDVYKSETCGCCEHWNEHMQDQDFGITSHHPVDLAAKKQSLGIEPRYQSCHTGVSADGYVFEGHVPAKLVTRFLEEKPEGAIGLAVPGMPVGSPGMEVEDRFMPYDVLLLKEDGSAELYARMETAEAQY